MKTFSISMPYLNMDYKIKHIPSGQFYYSSTHVINHLLLFVDFEWAKYFTSYESAYNDLKKLLGVSQINISPNYKQTQTINIIYVNFNEFEIIDERWD
jgi:hypothetical protein